MKLRVLPRLCAGLGLLLTCLSVQDAQAQDNRRWSAWQTIYNQGDAKVQISYALKPCKGQDLQGYSFYRTNTIVARPFKGYLRGKIKYLNCAGETGYDSFQANFEKPGIDDDMGQWFSATRVLSIEDIEFNDYSRSSTGTGARQGENDTEDSGSSSERSRPNKGNQPKRTDSGASTEATDLVIVNGIDTRTGKRHITPAQQQAQEQQARDQQAEEKRQQEQARLAEEQQLRQQREAEAAERKKNAQREQYQTYVDQGVGYQNSGNLSVARSRYESALSVAPTESEKADARARIAAVDQAVAQKAEEVRQERVTQQNTDNHAATQALQQTQSDETGMFLALAAAPIGLLFADLGENGPRNQYIKPSLRFSAHFGYSFQSLPIFLNDSKDIYTGNNRSKSISTSNGQLNTPNIEGGGELWPFYSGVFGIGAFANGNFGYWFQQKNWGFEWGGKAFLGHPNVQLLGEYRIGYRHLAHEELTDVNGGTASAIKISTNAVADYGFRRLGAGLRVNWNSSWGDPVRAHVDLMYLQETFPTSEILTQKQIGYSAMFWMDDRLCFYANYFPAYARTGYIAGDVTDFSLSGSMLRVGFYRTIDTFGGKR